MTTREQAQRVHLFEGPWLRANMKLEDEQPPAEYLIDGVRYRARSMLAVTHRDGSTGFDVDVDRVTVD